MSFEILVFDLSIKGWHNVSTKIVEQIDPKASNPNLSLFQTTNHKHICKINSPSDTPSSSSGIDSFDSSEKAGTTLGSIRVKINSSSNTDESPERHVSTPPASSSGAEINFTLPKPQLFPGPVRRGRGRPPGRGRSPARSRSSPRRGRSQYPEPYAGNRRPRR